MTTRARTTKAASTDDATADAPDADAVTAEPDTATEAEPEAEPAPSGTEYLNTTNGPIRYDREGHTIGGGEWTPPVNLDAIGQLARRRNYLVPRSAL